MIFHRALPNRPISNTVHRARVNRMTTFVMYRVRNSVAVLVFQTGARTGMAQGND